MIIKLAAIGALGYFGYRYLQNNPPREGASSVSLAGGPLSDQARIQSSPDLVPTNASDPL